MSITTKYSLYDLAAKGFESAQFQIVDRKAYVLVGFIGGTLLAATLVLDIFMMHGITNSYLGLSAHPTTAIYLLQASGGVLAVATLATYAIGAVKAVQLKKCSKKLNLEEATALLNEERTLIKNLQKAHGSLKLTKQENKSIKDANIRINGLELIELEFLNYKFQ